jgi:hypothetical protein
MSIKNRLAQLEKTHAPEGTKIFLVMYGNDGRATSASSRELAGMTRQEVAAYLGAGSKTVRVGVNLEEV